MIHSKVILHDIFYDISVNFLCTYPMLYTTGICDVMYIWVYNTYLHGKCFLSTLYNNIICLTPSQSTLLFVWSSDSSSHAYAISRSISLYTDQVTLPAEIQRAPCLLVQRMHVTPPLFSFGRPMLWMLSWDAVGLGLPLEMPLAVLLWMDNQFANENFTDFCASFCRHMICV
jgi:hypothetical protein